ncbi:hypothetical protein [Microbulbifer sp. TYP-18]|uniref:hypothetical protein n=1 Tax=Microbulbifer sp. TYP-18 TaxID=3230024 RepID=UPI0034C68DF2
MPAQAQVAPITPAAQIIAQSVDLADFSLESAEKLRALFRTISYIPNNDPTTRELAALGVQLANEWASVIDLEREHLSGLKVD